MSLVRFTQRSKFPSLWDNLVSTADEFSPLAAARPTAPALNIQEGETAFLLEFAVPGYSKESFDIEVDNGSLSVSYTNENNTSIVQNDFSRKEFYHNAFKRSFIIPDSVDSAKITAKHTNGILSIELPKKEEALAQPTQKIEIE